MIDLNVSSWPEPNLGGRREASIKLIVEIADPFIVVLILSLVVGVGGMSPPSVKKEAEEERHDEAGVKAVSVNVKDTVSFERTSSTP